MEKAARTGFPIPEVTLADLDAKALRFASVYAADRGLTRSIKTVRMNVLRRQGFGTIRSWLGVNRTTGWLNSFDVVESVGLLEYLQAADWHYTYNGIVSTKRHLARAVTYLRNAFECVRPGGLLIVGNMLDTHPQLGFTLDVVQWPHIQPRSIADMRSIIGKAGIKGEVEAHLPNDGVYAIYAIRKTRDNCPSR